MFGIASFRGGIHPLADQNKTAQAPIENLPAPPHVVLHMSQHAGSPARPVVQPGDHVLIGQMVGEPTETVSAAVHASVAGKVTVVKNFPHPRGKQGLAIVVENDGSNETIKLPALEKPWKEAAPGELLRIIADAGIVGLGGSAFPTHIKLSPPANKPINTLILNGVDDEPYLSADTSLMMEQTEGILTGALIIKKILGSKNVLFAVDSARQKTVERIARRLKDVRFKDISLAKLKPKYPQGSEKQLVEALLKKQIPSGGLAADCGCMVLNVATAYAVWNAVCNGQALYQCVFTVSGTAIRSPKNCAAPAGTPIGYILDLCGIDWAVAKKIVLGGAMTGFAQSDITAPLQKSTRGILAFDRLHPGVRLYDCINCGNCVKTCPIRLIPSFLAKFIGRNKIEEARKWGIMECIECGACSYACPAKINLVHFMQLGKYRISGRHPAEHFHD